MTASRIERPLNAASDLEQAENLRGAHVYDTEGMKIGEVEALFGDEGGRKVKFLLVSGDESRGIGDEGRLVPVEAVNARPNRVVFLRQRRQRVLNGPTFEPTRVQDPVYWEGISRWYRDTRSSQASPGKTQPATFRMSRLARR